MLEQILEDGWAYHDTQSARLADELEAAAGAVTGAALASFVQLATHTIGEHLGDWPRALALGRRVLAGRTPQPQTLSAWTQVAVAATLAGEAVLAVDLELQALAAAQDPLPQLLRAKLILAEALASSGRAEENARLLRAALGFAERLEPSAQTDRAVAVSSNNLAWSLQELTSRSADIDAVMRLAAQASLAAWRRCGDWVNEEQALYLNACVARALGDQEGALAAAAAGLDVIGGHAARPFDAARLHLVRARALAALGDPAGQAAALAAADAAARAITAEALKQRYADERARAEVGPELTLRRISAD